MQGQLSDAERQDRARRLARLADVLDAGIAVPGTSWRVGAESLIGLVPGLGDFAGLVLGTFVVHQAWRAGAPAPLLRRMAGNVVLDSLLGLVPVAGDLFDFAFRSNQRNVRLLLQHVGIERQPPPRATLALRVTFAIAAAAIGVGLWYWLR